MGGAVLALGLTVAAVTPGAGAEGTGTQTVARTAQATSGCSVYGMQIPNGFFKLNGQLYLCNNYTITPIVPVEPSK
jgi:hypothetical protein